MTKRLFIIQATIGVLATVAVLMAYFQYASVTLAQVGTVDVHIYKKIDGDPHGYSLTDFGYHITGDGFDQTIGSDATLSLVPGSYIVEEIVPNGFVKADWRVGWYGLGCNAEGSNQYLGKIEIQENDIGQYESPLPCEVNNQYRPVGDGDDDDNGGGGGQGTLNIVKVVVGTSTSPSAFSFQVNSMATTTFEADGTNSLTLATGTYAVTEVNPGSNYTVSYNNCSNISLLSAASSTCTITNTWNNNGGGGGGGTTTPEYRIEGYVWHDANQDGAWPEGETALDGWMVTITNGTTTATTTTNASGYYSFVVGAGTWTLFETLQNGWSQSFPNATTTYTVTVPQEEPEEMTLWFPFNLIFKTAQAAVINTYSGYNFGNFQSGGGGGNGDGGGGNGGGGDDDDDNGGSGGGGGGGSPRILGDQISVVPMVAPAAGMGGAASNLPNSLSFLWPFLAWLGF